MKTADFKVLDKQFEYNLWANDQMFALCSTLTADQLEVEAEGVFGKIQPTLLHLAYAENNYVGHLSDEWLFSRDHTWKELTIAGLHERVKVTSGRLLTIASSASLEKVHSFQRDDGSSFKFYGWTVLLQALYHGIEHRTQIKILLTQLGVEHPELASWDHAESLPINQS